MFRAIANIPLNLELSDKTAVARLAAQPLTFSDKYLKMSI
jgi:hypothetical protein